MSKVFENKVSNIGNAKLTLDGSELELPMIVGHRKRKGDRYLEAAWRKPATSPGTKPI